MSLTDKTIKAAIREAKRTGKQVWLTDGTKQRGIGRLCILANENGAQCYFRYVKADGARDPLPIGAYDESSATGLTLKDARARAGELSRLYQAGHRDLRAHLEHQSAEGRASLEAAARERVEAERQATSGTGQALLTGYVAHLKRQGKDTSATDAKNNFRRNVFEAFPEIAALPAAQLTEEDCSVMLAKLIERGVGRDAGKLRSYGAAAWEAARQAKSDPTIHPDLHGFNLRGNPWADVPAKQLAKYNRARERNLNDTEAHHFVKKLDARTGIAADAVKLAWYLGGQRSAQLLRVRPVDVDLDAGTIMLFDGKGARQSARPHLLPLTERAAEIAARYLALRTEDDQPKPYLFTSEGKGSVHLRTEMLTDVVTEISAEMVKEKTAREAFQMRDLRRTCETMFAKMGISKDHRAQVQSHGLGGVQDRHYDRHDYMDEKRRALEAWDARLRELADGAPKGNVVRLRTRPGA